MIQDICRTGAVAVGISLTLFVVGCAAPDHRATDDQQSCRSMGHVAGTAGFQACMADLNNRRCAVRRSRGSGIR